MSSLYFWQGWEGRQNAHLPVMVSNKYTHQESAKTPKGISSTIPLGVMGQK